MKLNIHTTDNRLIFDLLENSSAKIGDILNVPSGKLVYEGSHIKQGIELPTILMFTFEILIQINVGLFVEWLVQKVKDRAESIEINGKRSPVNKEKLKKAIREVLEEGKP